MRTPLLVPLLLVAPMLGSGCTIHGFHRGCIQLDGKGGYKNLADALTLAEDGSTLALCNRDVTESVTVDKNVSIVGLGAGSTVWIPPDGQPAITVTDGGEATVSGIWFQGSGTDLLAEAGGAIVANDVQLTAATWGIDATDAPVTGTGIVVEDSTTGGIHMSGAAAVLDLSDSRIDGNTGYGVLLEQGALGTLSGGVLRNTFVSDPNASQWDGFAVGLKSGSSASVSDVTANGNVLGVLYAEGSSTATLDNVSATNNYFAVWAENSDVTVTNSTIQNSQQYDVVGTNGATLDIEGTELSADPSSSAYEDQSSTLVGSYGILMQGALGLTLKGSTITGHNGGGVWAVGTVSQDMPAEIDDTTFDDNGSQALFTQWVDATLGNVDVTGTRNNDAGCIDTVNQTLSCNWGIGSFSSSLDWTGGALSGSEGIGLLVQDGSASVSGVDFADNDNVSVQAVSSALAVSDATVKGHGSLGIAGIDSVAQVRHTDFSDRDYTTSTFDNDGIETRTHDNALDIYAQGGTTTLSDLTFTHDDFGIDLDGTDATLADLALQGMLGFAIRQENGGSLDVQRVTMDQTGPAALTCSADGIDTGGKWTGTLSAADVTITDSKGFGQLVETFDASGNATGTSTTTYGGPVISADGCDTTLARVAITGADDNGITTNDSQAELRDVTVQDVARGDNPSGDPAIDLKFPTLDPTVIASGVSVSGVALGDGLSLTGNTGATGAQVVLEQLSLGLDDGDGISGIAGHGVLLTDVGCAQTSSCPVSVRDFDLANIGSTGISARGSWGTVAGRFRDTDFGGTITGAGGDGIRSVPDTDADPVRAGGLNVQDTTVTSPAAAGVALTAGIHAVTGLTVSSAGTWGMVCPTSPPSPSADVPVFTECTPDALDGASGALSGCDACAQP